MIRRPGRPRQFNEGDALDAMIPLFWEGGYEATSLDSLTAATGVARPSLAAAFGGKQAIYLAVAERFAGYMRLLFDETFAADLPLRPGLSRFFGRALDLYCSGGDAPRGCLVFCTAATPAASDAAVRELLARAIEETDTRFEAVFRRARARGDLADAVSPARAAVAATATLQTLALRARAGTPRPRLERIAADLIGLLCAGR